MSDSNIDRRNFLKTATAVTSALGATKSAFAQSVKGRVIGANDKITVGVIGTGGRGTYDGQQMSKLGDSHNVKIGIVCDVYKKRLQQNMDIHHVPGTLDYREVLANRDIDAVIVATPDHWHAPIALAAMKAGKDVYLEKPMCHTIEEAKMLVDTAKATGRIIQVGSQTTSGDQWAKAKQYIADGAIGKMIMSQGSYHRNSVDGEWNYKIFDAGPDKSGEAFIDWDMWLGNATKRPYDADRYFRFRKYWDYSGGIATDLFYHVVAPMNICWGEPQFPTKVMASGGIYQFKDEREVPDTFHLIGEYAAGHSIILSSSMANSQHIPGLIRGHAGTIIMCEHGKFESPTPFITVKPEKAGGGFIDKNWPTKFGSDKDIQVAVDDKRDLMKTHMGNFLDCVRSRQKPTLNVEIGARAQVLISLAVMSYRSGKTMYFDAANWKAVDRPVA